MIPLNKETERKIRDLITSFNDYPKRKLLILFNNFELLFYKFRFLSGKSSLVSK